MFQSTLPHGERRYAPGAKALTLMCFNPRSHMGSDESELTVGVGTQVSIHAPTWGATHRNFV